MGKKDVHKLSPEPHSVALCGISSHENDYRLSWAMNEHLAFRFAKAENHQSFNSRLHEFQEFSTYFYVDDYSNTYRLISNRCDNGFLLDELKNIDFLLLIEGIDPLAIRLALIDKMKAIPFISTVFPIDTGSLKNKKRIL